MDDFVDEIAVKRFVEGEYVGSLNSAEVKAAWMRMESAGWTRPRIAAHLRVGTSTIGRWRAAHGIKGKPGAPLDNTNWKGASNGA